jgi:hypothetical protein
MEAVKSSDDSAQKCSTMILKMQGAKNVEI